MIRRGDVRWCRFDRPDKRRPVRVLGRDDVLASLLQVPVVPFTSQVRGLSWELTLTPDEGLPTVCVLKPEWIRSVEASLPGPSIASFPERRWPELRSALLDALGFAPHD